jgi:hypothetical protein
VNNDNHDGDINYLRVVTPERLECNLWPTVSLLAVFTPTHFRSSVLEQIWKSEKSSKLIKFSISIPMVWRAYETLLINILWVCQITRAWTLKSNTLFHSPQWELGACMPSKQIKSNLITLETKYKSAKCCFSIILGTIARALSFST